MRIRNLRTAGLLSVAVGIGATGLVGATGGAGAATNGLPAGYVVVTGDSVTAVNGRQTHAPVACPGTTKPVGGGAHIDSTSMHVTLNSSYPVGRNSWSVHVNNLSGADVTFEVYAVCIDRPAENFTVQTTFVPGPAHSVAGATTGCGSGVVYGGGVQSSSVNSAISIHDMGPTGAPPTWVVHMNNPTAKPEAFTVFTICRKGSRRSVYLTRSDTILLPRGTQRTPSANCISPSFPLSGGVLSDAGPELGLSMSSSVPSGLEWQASENNTSTSSKHFVHASAICLR